MVKQLLLLFLTVGMNAAAQASIEFHDDIALGPIEASVEFLLSPDRVGPADEIHLTARLTNLFDQSATLGLVNVSIVRSWGAIGFEFYSYDFIPFSLPGPTALLPQELITLDLGVFAPVVMPSSSGQISFEVEATVTSASQGLTDLIMLGESTVTVVPLPGALPLFGSALLISALAKKRVQRGRCRV